MALNTNAKFYRLDYLPSFDAGGKHVGLFVYVQKYTPQSDVTQGYYEDQTHTWGGQYPISGLPTLTLPANKPIEGLWFGGRLGWEKLTNVGSGISWDEIYDWFDSNVAGEAEIFSAETLDNSQGQYGTEITIYDPILDRNENESTQPGTFGLHASTDTSDAHSFTVGDGALKLIGNQQALSNNEFVVEQAFDIHSANDTVNNTLTLDNSLYVTKGSESGAPYSAKIGVRVGSNPVTPTNPIVTLADIADLSGAMHLVGTLDKHTDPTGVGAAHIWPTVGPGDNSGSHWITSGTVGTDADGNQQVLLKAGDTFIVTTAFDGPDDQTGTGNVHYEVGDTVLFYNGSNGLTYKVVNQNITTGTNDGQHAPVDMPNGGLVAGKLVIATQSGIATTNAQISDFVTDVTSTQEINDTAQETEDEGQTHETTYTVTTIVDRVDDGSDSNITTDTHDLIFHSNNNSLTIQEDTTNAEHQINFDLVWLTTMV